VGGGARAVAWPLRAPVLCAPINGPRVVCLLGLPGCSRAYVGAAAGGAHVRTSTHTHAHTRTCTHAQIRAQTLTPLHLHTHTYMLTHTTHTYTRTHTRLHAHKLARTPQVPPTTPRSPLQRQRPLRRQAAPPPCPAPLPPCCVTPRSRRPWRSWTRPWRRTRTSRSCCCTGAHARRGVHLPQLLLYRCACAQGRVCVRVCVRAHACNHVCVLVCVCACVCMYASSCKQRSPSLPCPLQQGHHAASREVPPHTQGRCGGKGGHARQVARHFSLALARGLARAVPA